MERIDLNILKSESSEAYHAKAGAYLSSHQLLDFMNCPYLHHCKVMGELEEKDSAALQFGRAAHVAVLEGMGEYARQYAVGGPINPSTGKPYGATSKKYLDWAQEQDRPVMTFEKHEQLLKLSAAVRRHPLVEALLREGRAEGVLRVTYRDIPCQIRIDWISPEYGLVDLKTCDDLKWFEHDAGEFRYANQLAFYRSVLAVAIRSGSGDSEEAELPAYLIGVEKRPPYRCGVWQLTRETLDAACAENEAAIERLKESRRENRWPTGYEELRYLHF